MFFWSDIRFVFINLYEETQTVNTSTTDGYFNILIGSAVGDGKRSSGDSGKTMAEVYQNQAVVVGKSLANTAVACNSAANAAAMSGSVRYFRITVTPSATAVAEVLSPDMTIDSVPSAIIAQSLQGLNRDQVAQINSGQGVTQANLEAIFSRYSTLDAILNGSFTGNVTGNVSGTAANVTGTVAIANGGTGATSASVARSNLGLGSLATITPTGTADNTTYLRGDGTWSSVVGGVASVASKTGVVTLVASDITDFTTAADNRITTVVGAWKNVNNGIAGLDANGRLSASLMPALTGDVTTSAGAVATTIANNAVTTTKINDGAVTAVKLGSDVGVWSVSTGDVYRSSGSVGIGAAPVASALLDLTSTTKGVLIPRMTTAERDAIASPATGLQVYNTTTNVLNYHNGTSWQALGVAGSGISSLTAGTGLTGGTITTSGTVAVDVGTTANKIVQLDGSAKLPAVDGSALTNLNAANIASGTMPIARGGTNSATALNNDRIMISNGGAIVEAAALTNGQLLIGSTGAAPTAATLTAGSGITITNSAGGISIATSGAAPTGSAGGDLSGSYPNPAVAKLQGNAVASTTLVVGDAGKTYVWNGTSLTAQYFGIADLKKSDGTSQFSSASCAANQTLTWSSLTDLFVCANIGSLNASAITAGTLDAARMPALTGDVTTSAGAVATTIANNAVTTAKINDAAVTDAKITSMSVGKLTNAAATYFNYKPANTACADTEVLVYDSTLASGAGGWKCGTGGGGGGSGTVTSVAFSAPAQFSVTNSPVTTTGTLTMAWASQNAALVLASPTGASGAPSFRSLASTDLPTSGVSASTYKSVTVDVYGRVTGGTNPTTLSGFGITDGVVNGGQAGSVSLGSTDANSLVFKTNNVTRMTMDSSGNVGIGTVNPASKFEVNGNSSNVGGVILSGSSGTYSYWGLGRTAAEAYLGTVSTATNWSNISTTGDFVIRADTEDIILAARNASGSIRFATGSADTEKMTLSNSGNLGIGATTPGARLTVKGSGITSATSSLNVTDSSGNSKFYVRDDGSVGIGTSSPGEKLEVSGSIKIVDGTQGNGKVLTSDASGKASWQTPSGGGGFAGAVDANSTPYTITSSDNGKAFYYSNNANGVINLPALSGVSDGFSVTVHRQVAKTLTITPNGSDKFPGGVTTIEMQGKNLQSVTIMKLGSVWALINQTEECTVGNECWTADATGGMKQIFAGTYNGKQYFTTPGGCTNSGTPTCAGGTDTVTKAWATTAPESNSTIGMSNYADGKSQSATLAGYATAQAAQFCENMNYAGYTDWYLPARQELDLIYRNSSAIGGFVYSNNYWSSTENTTTHAWLFYFNGYVTSLTKTNGYYVRCVRRF